MNPQNRPSGAACVVLVAFLSLSCGDTAKPDLDRCERLESEQKFAEAAKACQEAYAKDPDGKSGKRAHARLPLIETKRRERERERAALEGKMQAELRDADEHLDQLKAKLEHIAARETTLRSRLERASEPAEKKRIEAELAAARADRDAVMNERHSGSGKKPCNCPPGDALCSCL